MAVVISRFRRGERRKVELKRREKVLPSVSLREGY